MREAPRITEEQLRACFQDQYDLHPVTMEFLPLGLDYNAGVYRVVDEQGTAYLLKASSRPLYEPSYRIPRYLHDQGITSVVAPLPTKNHALWTMLAGWTVAVYPWISGESSLTGMTNEQWKELGSIFKQIHHVRLLPEDFTSLRKETFDPTEYARWIHTFETQHLQQCLNGSGSLRALGASWMTHQPTIHMIMASMEKMAEVIQSQTFSNVICHADLHPANLLRNAAGQVFVIDWDEVMLAPKERDFIFIREPQADAFWEGYGLKEIDWMLLTYYQWERVMQDIMADAQDVCSRDDWAEETRAHVAKSFDEYLSEEGDNLSAAYQASAHLESNFIMHKGG